MSLTRDDGLEGKVAVVSGAVRVNSVVSGLIETPQSLDPENSLDAAYVTWQQLIVDGGLTVR